MEEDTEYKKLPIEERCVHKLWKARLNGYEESIKIFREIDDEKSSEWNKFMGLIKKFVIDSHAMCQERGLEATLIFVENCANATRIVGDVVAGIVAKSIAASKTKTRELSVQVILLFIEIEKQEAVVEELIKGMDQKNPKIVAACTSTICEALKEFGSKIISLKPVVKKLATLLSDRDKSVRDEGKRLAVEIYRWIGPALKPQISTMPALILTELESEFEKQKSNKAEPTRYIRSQQEQKKIAAASAGDGDVDDENDQNDDDGATNDVDPLAFVDAVEILSKLPKDFYDKLESKKWQERKESMEALETLLKNPKLENGDYGELIKALRKVIAKDTNVMLVAMAGKSLASLANGLKRHFTPYAHFCIPVIYEKFKEKKTNVVAALREALDAIYPCTTFEAIFEESLEALNNKNPNVKTETCLFLARAFSKTQPTQFNKKILKTLMATLVKTLNESDPAVRDASAEVLATLSKLLGEKVVSPYLSEIDPLKLAKIKESADKVVLNVKSVAAAKNPTKPKLATAASTKSESRPTTSSRDAPPKRIINSATIKRSKPASAELSDRASAKSTQFEREMTPEEVIERATEIFSSQLVAQICDTNWKTRLVAAENCNEMCGTLDAQPGLSQCIIKLVCQKPGLKETNIQVLKTKLEIIKTVSSRFGISQITAEQVVPEIADRMGDTKSVAEVGQALTVIAEHLGCETTVIKVLSFAMEKKSPKIQSEALVWAASAIGQYNMQGNGKTIAEYIKKGLQSTNTTVRQAAIGLFGAMIPHVGGNFIAHFDSEKPALKQQLQLEMEKNMDSKSVSPTTKSDDMYDDDDVGSTDVLTRVDISSHITEALLAELSDKNWKNRNEALLKIQGFLKDAKHIKSTIGDLPQALALRLVDSNAKIAQVSLSICQTLAEAMGSPCKQYLRILFPGILNGLGDSKAFIRTASITCLNVWGEQAGYKEFFDGEIIADSLKAGSSPVLRSEMWAWLTIVLPKCAVKSISKDELLAALPHLYSNICDRNADVRKNANDAIYGFMLHLSYEGMVKALEKQKPTSKKDILAALDKTRPNMPIKPLPKQRQQAPIIDEPQRPIKSPSSKSIKTSGLGKTAPVTSRKKEEEIDTTPFLAINNLKNQRLLDEQKLKVLKWAFTTPREEFTDLLRDQMTAANVNKGLMANMFHDDFRYHLKAIESLQDDLPTNTKALISNLDLILKWISLRLYDTNPSVLLKGLEYLNLVFPVLLDNEYSLAENEGSCFIPHLLTKFGDPKDTVRSSVRSIFRQMCLVYPFTKIFCYIMDGLKSKNARQRTECLDELGYLIETYTISVCQPSPQLALKEIAKHISDRDNSVRNAALNCVVQAYFLVGEKIYKLVGNLNEKDLSMLDERIKRAKKNRVVVVETNSKSVTPPRVESDIVDEEIVQQPKLIKPEIVDDVSTETSYEEDVKPQVAEPSTLTSYPTIPHQLTEKRPFGLDPAVIAEIEKDWVRSDQIILHPPPKLDLSFLQSPLKSCEKDGISYPPEKLAALIQRGNEIQERTKMSNFTTNTSPLKLHTSGSLVYSPRSPNVLAGAMKISPKQVVRDPNLVRILQSIGSQDTNIAAAALNEFNEILENPAKQAALKDYEEMYVESIYTQFKNLSQIPLNKSLHLYQPVLTSTYSFFTSIHLGKNIGIESLKKLMSVLLSLMTDHKLTSGDDGQYTKVINGICLRILDRTNFTNLNCSLIRLLKETCLNVGFPKFTDLLMKCIWRNVKKMPEKSHELDYELVLLEINEFMLRLPSIWWTQRPSDTPLRTVKTIIHNMAKIKGPSILDHLKQVPEQSELHTYLLKVLKNVQKDNPNAGQISENRMNYTELQQQQQQQLDGNTPRDYKFNKVTHDSITQIFKLISEKETNREGIKKLFDFKKQNPMVDITPFIKGANPVFKKYIEDQLDEIEQSNRRTNSDNTGTFKVTPSAIHVPNDKFDADYWMQKLVFLTKKTKDAD